jgi:hypothetical protein
VTSRIGNRGLICRRIARLRQPEVRADADFVALEPGEGHQVGS